MSQGSKKVATEMTRDSRDPDWVTTERVSRYIEEARNGSEEAMEWLRDFLLATLQNAGPKTVLAMSDLLLKRADEYCTGTMFDDKEGK